MKSLFKILVFNIQRGEGENRRGAMVRKVIAITSDFRLRTPVFRLVFN